MSDPGPLRSGQQELAAAERELSDHSPAPSRLQSQGPDSHRIDSERPGPPLWLIRFCANVRFTVTFFT